MAPGSTMLTFTMLSLIHYSLYVSLLFEHMVCLST